MQNVATSAEALFVANLLGNSATIASSNSDSITARSLPGLTNFGTTLRYAAPSVLGNIDCGDSSSEIARFCCCGTNCPVN